MIRASELGPRVPHLIASPGHETGIWTYRRSKAWRVATGARSDLARNPHPAMDAVRDACSRGM